jgi:hypothetical protein
MLPYLMEHFCPLTSIWAGCRVRAHLRDKHISARCSNPSLLDGLRALQRDLNTHLCFPQKSRHSPSPSCSKALNIPQQFNASRRYLRRCSLSWDTDSAFLLFKQTRLILAEAITPYLFHAGSLDDVSIHSPHTFRLPLTFLFFSLITPRARDLLPGAALCSA